MSNKYCIKNGLPSGKWESSMMDYWDEVCHVVTERVDNFGVSIGVWENARSAWHDGMFLVELDVWTNKAHYNGMFVAGGYKHVNNGIKALVRHVLRLHVVNKLDVMLVEVEDV